MGLQEGDWWLHSKSDPRWNCGGEALVGMFMTMDSCPDALAAYTSKKKKYGEPPEDLEFGYMKA